METRCSEGSPHGDKVTLSFYIPEQDAIDAGELPDFSINVLDLLVEEESKGVEGTAGLFVVDALAVFMDEAHDAESADTVAQWLETMAAKVREKFNPSNARSEARPACGTSRSTEELDTGG